MKKRRLLPIISRGICGLGLSLSSFLALTLTFHIRFSRIHILFVVLFSLLFSAVLSARGRWKLLILPVLLCFVGYGVFLWKPATSSLLEIGNVYIRAFNAYNSGVNSWASSYFSPGDPGLIVLGFLLSLTVCSGIFLLRSTIIAALPLGAVICAGIFTAQFPPLWVLLLAVVSLLLFSLTDLLQTQLTASEKGTHRAALHHFGLGLGALALLTAALLCISFPLAPQLMTYTDSLKSFQAEFWSNKPLKLLPEQNSSRPQLSGKDTPREYRLNNGPLQFSGQPTLEILANVPPASTLYLKDQAFGNYRQGSWGPVPYAEFNRFLSEKKLGAADIFEPPPDYPGRVSPAEITVIRFPGITDHSPYFSLFPESALPVGDGYLRGLQSPQTFTILPFSWDAAGGGNPAYEDFVRSTYLNLPPNIENLRALTEDWDTDSPQELSGLIRDTLDTLADYSMDITPISDGSDYVENFLFTQKKGYCQHFASAAVLLFRLEGIPARFATGYAVPGRLFQQQEEGYRALVTDNMAHAWPEIYLSGLGWVPVEVTPGGVDSQLNTGSETAEPTATPSPGPEATVAPTPLPSASASARPGASTPAPVQREPAAKMPGWLLPVLIFLAAAVIAAAGVCLRRRQKEQRRRKQRTPLPLIADLMALLEFCLNVQQGKRSDREFLLESFQKAGLEEGAFVAALAYDCAFGGKQEPDQEALIKLRAIYSQAVQVLRPGLPVYKKLLFDWLYCFRMK